MNEPIQVGAVRQSSALQPSSTLVVAQRVSHSSNQTEGAGDGSLRSDADVDIGTLHVSTSHSNTTPSSTNDEHTDDSLHEGLECLESLADVDHVSPVGRAENVEVDMTIPLDCFDPGTAPAKPAASSNAVRRSRKKANSLPTLPSARSSKELERDGAKDEKCDKTGMNTSTRATDNNSSSAQMLLSQLVSLTKDANSSFAEQTLASSLIFQTQCIDLLRVQRQGHDARIQYLERTLSRMEQVLGGMTQQLTQIAFYNQALLERVFSGVVHSQMSLSEGATTPSPVPHASPRMVQQVATSPIGQSLQSTMRIETPSDASTQSHSQTTTRSESPSVPSLSPTASPEQMARPPSAPGGLSLATSVESMAMQQSVPQLVSLSNPSSGYKSMAILTPLSYTKTPVEQPIAGFPAQGSPTINTCGTFPTVPPPPFSPIQPPPPPSGPPTTASIPLSIAGGACPGATLSTQLPHASNQYPTPFPSHFVKPPISQVPQFAAVVASPMSSMGVPNPPLMTSPGALYANHNHAAPHVAHTWSWNNNAHNGNTGPKSSPTSKSAHGRRK